MDNKNKRSSPQYTKLNKAEKKKNIKNSTRCSPPENILGSVIDKKPDRILVISKYPFTKYAPAVKNIPMNVAFI